MSSLRTTLVLLGVFVMSCSSGDDGQGQAAPVPVEMKGCKDCACHGNGQCDQGLACDDEHFASPGTCVQEVPYLDCFSGKDRCMCDVRGGPPTDHPSTSGCGDLPSAHGGGWPFLCCAGEGYPDEGTCLCDRLPSPGAFTCDDYADSMHQVTECKKGVWAPPPGGGTIGGSGGSGVGGGSSSTCDSSECRGSTECTDFGCVVCSKHCSKDGCVNDGCSDTF